MSKIILQNNSIERIQQDGDDFTRIWKKEDNVDMKTYFCFLQKDLTSRQFIVMLVYIRRLKPTTDLFYFHILCKSLFIFLNFYIIYN